MRKITWKPIKGYEGLYEINEKGIVRSLNRAHFQKIKSDRIDHGGYRTIRLNKKSKTATAFVHRLIAEAFISNPKNKGFVNHIDGNKLNNEIENLEWVTHSENMLHAYRTGLCKPNCKKVIDTCNGNEFHSAKEAAEFYDISYGNCRNMLNGNRRNTTCLQYAA
jgi:hypothetical protein